jgi:anti-sigma B factor antagonist
MRVHRVDSDSDVVIVRLDGDIDVVNSSEVRDELLSAALDGGPRFVADLDDVGYIDSNGVRMLFGVAREFAQSRISWVVVLHPDSPLQRLFKVTAFDEVVRLAPSCERAVEMVREDG